jgi:sigma-B regulation protein RsbU (phosphoserine phosphatase)
VEPVQTLGTWVGATRDVGDAMQDSTTRLRDGDVLVLYTDGVIEAMNQAGEQFGTPRLVHEIERAGSRPVAEIRDQICSAVTEFMDQQRDDIALLVARYRTPS